MHGGAVGSGAPAGNRNAQTHGLSTADAIAERQTIRSLLDDAYGVLEKFDGARLPSRPATGTSDDDGTPG
jgi:glucans biosynthesis protein